MAKVESVICDICGKEMHRINLRFHFATIILYEPFALRSNRGQRIDLCDECYQKFVQFMENSEAVL